MAAVERFERLLGRIRIRGTGKDPRRRGPRPGARCRPMSAGTLHETVNTRRGMREGHAREGWETGEIPGFPLTSSGPLNRAVWRGFGGSLPSACKTPCFPPMGGIDGPVQELAGPLQRGTGGIPPGRSLMAQKGHGNRRRERRRHHRTAAGGERLLRRCAGGHRGGMPQGRRSTSCSPGRSTGTTAR